MIQRPEHDVKLLCKSPALGADEIPTLVVLGSIPRGGA